MSSAAKSRWNVAINIALAFAIMLLQSWFTDGIKGDELFPWLPGGALKPGHPASWWCLLGMLALSIACAVLLYQRRRSFLPVEVRRIGQPDLVDPRSVLVLLVSRPQWEWKPQQLSRMRGAERDCRPLPATLDEALAKMYALPRGEQFAWEQLLRAISPHASCRPRLILIGSSGNDGTAESFTDCRDMIAHYFPNLDPTQIETRTASFESLDQLLNVYRKIVADNAGRKDEIMIDVTGGTKVASIAAAMVTLQHPEVEFQYVETEGEKRIRSFNVLSPETGNDFQ